MGPDAMRARIATATAGALRPGIVRAAGVDATRKDSNHLGLSHWMLNATRTRIATAMAAALGLKNARNSVEIATRREVNLTELHVLTQDAMKTRIATATRPADRPGSVDVSVEDALHKVPQFLLVPL